MNRLSRTSVRAGAVAAGLLAAFYAVVVGIAGGLEHLADQTATDWPWLTLIIGGFGTQVALLAELRRRHRLLAAAGGVAGTGAGASAAGMVACCAHHLADLAPIAAASGAAVFLTEFRLPIMIIGILVNALGVAVAFRRLRRTPIPADGLACVHS
ncbi:hypothetical protein [Thermoactinospora rubra]|uniref:hypothetical protein n=1 Tax=Thermoactinospora rubra TaxID=1088767 RepID=UPI00117BE478|nr:hypothetical protein [Thermoactinospora rubra]